MKTVCLIILLVIIQLLVRAQLRDFTYLKDPIEGMIFLGASASFATVSNNDVPHTPTGHSLSGILLDLQVLRPSFKKNGYNYRWDYKLIPDLIFLGNRVADRKGTANRQEESTITGGVIGWHSFAWNIISNKRWSMGAGFCTNDYIIGTTYNDTVNKELITPEPQGWYLSAGPSVVAAFALNRTFILYGSIMYAMSFSRPVSISYADVEGGYPRPHVVHANTMLLSKWGVFIETQWVQLINRGHLPNAVKRIELKLGFNFEL